LRRRDGEPKLYLHCEMRSASFSFMADSHSEVAQDLKSGTGQPKPGYIGKDYFEVEVSYERSGTRLKTVLQADVTITN